MLNSNVTFNTITLFWTIAYCVRGWVGRCGECVIAYIYSFEQCALSGLFNSVK
jgi:hypothetical protein